MMAAETQARTLDPIRAAAIRELLGGAAYARLFAAARRRLEEAGPACARSFVLRDLTMDERCSLADLFAWPALPEGDVRIRLDRLDAVLRSGRVGAGTAEVIEALGGPLADRRAERASERTRADALWARASGHPAVEGRPALVAWLDDLRRLGLPARAAREPGSSDAEILEAALEVVARLPANGVPLAVLAADATGDAHALDIDRPLAGLVLRAAVALAGWPSAPAAAGLRRRLWGEVGVLCDELSVDVLVLGLRPVARSLDHSSTGSRIARHLAASADAGAPLRLLLRDILREPPDLTGTSEVFVCENPGIVALAADRLGGACAPLVCTEGVPSTAAITLIEALARNGTTVRFHADFDWGGIRVGNRLAALPGARPWRFDAGTYRASVAAGLGGRALLGSPIQASWDPDLSAAMSRTDRAVFEEQVVEDLVTDLATGSE